MRLRISKRSASTLPTSGSLAMEPTGYISSRARSTLPGGAAGIRLGRRWRHRRCRQAHRVERLLGRGDGAGPAVPVAVVERDLREACLEPTLALVRREALQPGGVGEVTG